MSRLSRARSGGYSLIELLVAVSVFAVISLITFGGLTTLTRSAERLREARSALADLQRSVDALARELAQAAPRGTRDVFGEALPALSGSAGEISFVRAGWSNPLGHPRASFQRIAWLLEDAQLVRRHHAVLDSGPSVKFESRELLDEVERLSFRFLGTDGRWRDRWPESGADIGLPRAVEFRIATDRHGEVRRVIELVERPASALEVIGGG